MLLEQVSIATLKKVELFSTYFYKKLTSHPRKMKPLILEMSEAEQNYENVRKWIKNTHLLDGKKLIFFPINEEDHHWYLIIFVFPNSSDCNPYAAVLDSVGGNKDIAVNKLKDFLIQEKKAKNIEQIDEKEISDIQIEYVKVARQNDGSSCGLYLINYVKHILLGIENGCLRQVFGEKSELLSENMDSKRFELSRLILKTGQRQGYLEGIHLPDFQCFPTVHQDKEAKHMEQKKTEKEAFTTKRKRSDSEEKEDPRKRKVAQVQKSYLNYIKNLNRTQKDITLRRTYHTDDFL